jgi:hypothetical protein
MTKNHGLGTADWDTGKTRKVVRGQTSAKGRFAEGRPLYGKRCRTSVKIGFIGICC